MVGGYGINHLVQNSRSKQAPAQPEATSEGDSGLSTSSVGTTGQQNPATSSTPINLDGEKSNPEYTGKIGVSFASFLVSTTKIENDPFWKERAKESKNVAFESETFFPSFKTSLETYNGTT